MTAESICRVPFDSFFTILTVFFCEEVDTLAAEFATLSFHGFQNQSYKQKVMVTCGYMEYCFTIVSDVVANICSWRNQALKSFFITVRDLFWSSRPCFNLKQTSYMWVRVTCICGPDGSQSRKLPQCCRHWYREGEKYRSSFFIHILIQPRLSLLVCCVLACLGKLVKTLVLLSLLPRSQFILCTVVISYIKQSRLSYLCTQSFALLMMPRSLQCSQDCCITPTASAASENVHVSQNSLNLQLALLNNCGKLME